MISLLCGHTQVDRHWRGVAMGGTKYKVEGNEYMLCNKHLFNYVCLERH